jgi:hypothetical protein
MARETQTQSKQEFDPDNQVDPRWAAQFEKFTAAIAQGVVAQLGLKPGTVIERAVPDRESLTTEAEAKEYDDMLQQDFLKIDPAKKKIMDRRTLYKPIHIFPQFQSANPNEFIAYLVIEVYRWEKAPDESKRRQVVDCFNIKAKLFKEQYKPTMVAANPELEEEETKK